MIKNISHTTFTTMLWLCSLLLCTSAIAADIQVKIDRSQIELNETFTLVFESSDSVDGDPDFSPLEKDFEIISQGTSSNISIINGQYTRSQRWNLSMVATKEGSLTIPPISFGKDTSPAHKITISPVRQSSGNGAAGEEFISELEVNQTSSYPQAQIIVTQRMLSSKNITGYEFSQLKADGVDVSVESLGEVKQFQTQRGPTQYLVLEKSFALYPQTSGTLKIEPSMASARLSLNSRNSYDPFRSNTKTVRRISDAKSIKINPIPKAFKGSHWLVAREVQLVEEFPEQTEYKVGEPITRTLSLLADGQSASQLPEFDIQEQAGLKLYPDQPVLNNQTSDSGVTGIQQIKVAIIPSTSGEFTLPEITVPWWNIKTQKMETARLKARSFKVAAASHSTAPVSKLNITPEKQDTPISNNIPKSTTAQPLPQDTSLTPEPTNSFMDNVWFILFLLLFFVWLYTLYLYWKLKQNINSTHASDVESKPSLRDIYKKLETACQNHNASDCKDALLLWANVVFIDKTILSLGELANQVSSPLSESVTQLNSALYKHQADEWQCQDLLSLCQQVESVESQRHVKATSPDELETLYK